MHNAPGEPEEVQMHRPLQQDAQLDRTKNGWEFDELHERFFVRMSTNAFVLNSAELGDVARFIAARREQMKPELTLSPHDARNGDVWVSDSYVYKESRLTQTAHLWSRVPGLGWVHLQLDAEPLRDLATSILAMIGPAPVAPASLN